MNEIRENEDLEKFLLRNQATNVEFFVARSFSPDFLCRLIFHGFLPMCHSEWGNTRYMLLPKLHRNRCVMELGDATVSKELHVGRKVRKAAKNFKITLDTCFDEVVAGCVKQHGYSCWLYPPLMASLKTLVPCAANDFGAKNPHGVVAHTFELWDKEGNLVAGEVGYHVGGSYTSMSGFHFADSSGSVQCCATARLLERLGFDMWDLGMSMKYKLDMGATSVPRGEFLRKLARTRTKTLTLKVPEPTLASQIICYDNSPNTTNKPKPMDED